MSLEQQPTVVLATTSSANIPIGLDFDQRASQAIAGTRNTVRYTSNNGPTFSDVNTNVITIPMSSQNFHCTDSHCVGHS